MSTNQTPKHCVRIPADQWGFVERLAHEYGTTASAVLRTMIEVAKEESDRDRARVTDLEARLDRNPYARVYAGKLIS